MGANCEGIQYVYWGKEMLLDGFWKKDLRAIKRSMNFWSKNRIALLREYAEHKINQGFLFSAIILRKIYEDEKEAESICNHSQYPELPLPILKIKIKVKKYNHIDEKKIFMVSGVFLQDYDLEHVFECEESLYYIGSQIIHSYAWSIVYLNEKRIYGVLLASDRVKEREMYLLTVSSWIEALERVIAEAHI